MIPRARLWYLARLALLPAVLIVVFLSGLFPLKQLFSAIPQNLTASIAAFDVASLTNEQRIQNGLAPLSVSPLLTQAAQDKAEDMAQKSYYAHVSPEGKTPLYWLDHVGYRYLNAGENLVIDRTTSEQAIDAWMNSPDHRENILRPQFTEIGIGVAKGEYDGFSTIYVVQEFGTPYPTVRTISVTSKAEPAKVIAKPVEQVTLPVATPIVATAQAESPTQASVVVPTTPISVPHIPKVAAPRISALVAHKISIPSVATSAPATTTSLGQGTSTISYALAPEFYAPVTVSIGSKTQSEASETPPKASSDTALAVLFHRIRVFLGHVFNKNP